MSTTVGNRRLFQRLNGDGYQLGAIDEGVVLEARHVRREFSKLVAEVTVRVEWQDARTFDGVLGFTALDLTSQTARSAFAAYLEKRDGMPREAFDWAGAVDELAIRTVTAELQSGDPPIRLDDAIDIATPDFDVHGLKVPSDAPSLLIAHGDSLKSFLLLLVLGTFAQRGHRVAYLDWEWSAHRHKARKVRLFGADRLDTLHYVRCTAPLTHELDRLRRFRDDERIAFWAVDSIGLAADGKLADDDTARRFYRALGQLGPAMCAAHVAKSSLSADPKQDPVGAIGSVFWTNLARLTYVVKKQSSSEDLVTVGCIPQKQNDGTRVLPAAFEFSFSSGRITVTPASVTTMDGLADRVPWRQRIRELIKSSPATIAELTAALEGSPDTIRKTVRRGLDDGSFVIVPSVDGKERIALTERRLH